MAEYDFTAPLWRWAARRDNWYFVTVPADLSDEIAAMPRPPRGFGGVRVEVTVQHSTWQTSIFPDSGLGVYVLPMKQAVLRRHGIEEGEAVEIQLVLV